MFPYHVALFPQNLYNVSNSNFFPVKITGVLMKSLYGNAVIAQSWAYKTDPMEISARSERELSVPMNFELKGEHGSLVYVFDLIYIG